MGVAGLLPGRLRAKAGSHSVGVVRFSQAQQALKGLNGCAPPHHQPHRPHLTLSAGEEATKKGTDDGGPFICMGIDENEGKCDVLLVCEA